jgi:hypothetical protein
MNYNTLDLDHFNFFCPATGVQILGDELCDDSVPSLMGYWVDLSFEDPVLKNPDLHAAWESFSSAYAEENEEDSPGHEDLTAFLKVYDAPNWAVFEITTSGMACGPVSSTVWLVIDLNVERAE